MTLKQTIEDQARILAVEAHGTHDEDWPDRDQMYCDFVCGANFTARHLLELWQDTRSYYLDSQGILTPIYPFDGTCQELEAMKRLDAYAEEMLGKK